MNMTEKNMTHVFLGEAGFAKIDNHIVESRLRAGIEQRDPIICLQSSGGHDPGMPELSRI
jgi:hypothetical protein